LKSKELPNQKNYDFYSKEPVAFRTLKRINKERRSTFDVKGFEGKFSPRASDEYFTHNSNNFLSKNNEKFVNFIKEKDNNYESVREKDIKFVKDHLGITQNSSK